MSEEQDTCPCSSKMSSKLRTCLQRGTLTPKRGSFKPIRCARRKRASGELMISHPHVLKSRSLLHEKDMKKKVLEAVEAADVQRNENGGLELHRRTYFAWTTATPGAPLKNSG